MSKLLISLGLVVCLVMAFALPMCAPAPPVEEEAPPVVEEGPYEKYVSSLPEGCFPVPRGCFEQAIEEGELNIYDWAGWWPEEVYKDFEKEFGIKISRDHYGSEDELASKFRLYPDMPYDYALPDDKREVELIEIGALAKLNHEWLPNVTEYYPESCKGLWFDPDYDYGIILHTGFTTYAWNTKYVDDPRVPSWSVYFEPDEKYRGKVIALDEMYEVIGCALKYLGYSYCSDDEEELMQAKEVLLKQKPYIVAYSSVPKDLLLSEEGWLAMLWGGESWWFHHTDMPWLDACRAAEGSLLHADVLVIPRGVTHPAAAHLWLNYLYRPQVSAVIDEMVGWLSTNPAARELLSAEMRAWPGVEIPEEYAALCDIIEPRMYTGIGQELRSQIWEEVKS